jgi:hypothetical protein
MKDTIKDMQDRLNKIGTSKPYIPQPELPDHSEMEARLSKMPQYEFTGHPNPGLALPEAKSIPAPAISYRSQPEALPTPPAKSNSYSVPVAPVEKSYQPVENELTSTYSTARDVVEAPESTFHSPSTAPQSKGRSNWLLWVGVALFVAFVIAQLWFVMS